MHTRAMTVSPLNEESVEMSFHRQSTTSIETAHITKCASGKWNDKSTASHLQVYQYEYTYDAESSQCTASYMSTQSTRQDPYQDVSIDVTNYSFTGQGVVMYHVDIKGPEGVLSTYTIRRRYRAFRNLYHLLQRFYAKHSTGNSFSMRSFSSREVSMDKFPIENALLPALPSAGMWSYLKRHDIRLVEQRKKQLEDILRVATRHPIMRHCPALDAFFSVAPSEISQRGSSYVSLQDYSVPKLDKYRESMERKRRRMRVLEGKRKTRAMSDAELVLPRHSVGNDTKRFSMEDKFLV
uniref:Uncharacterized protein AlNc14C130G6946 n=1 Tax=Albugo laibachii Nc14 TaxID=890382 RepID=F0WK94_9STRA|nr:conserved hypothetical protein [Albugo laibachii Nc14]|eukprot:CCA21697.1 conserved hypothetical protein [Albugo laibachii Nc14]